MLISFPKSRRQIIDNRITCDAENDSIRTRRVRPDRYERDQSRAGTVIPRVHYIEERTSWSKVSNAALRSRRISITIPCWSMLVMMSLPSPVLALCCDWVYM